MIKSFSLSSNSTPNTFLKLRHKRCKKRCCLLLMIVFVHFRVDFLWLLLALFSSLLHYVLLLPFNTSILSFKLSSFYKVLVFYISFFASYVVDTYIIKAHQWIQKNKLEYLSELLLGQFCVLQRGAAFSPMHIYL